MRKSRSSNERWASFIGAATGFWGKCTASCIHLSHVWTVARPSLLATSFPHWSPPSFQPKSRSCAENNLVRNAGGYEGKFGEGVARASSFVHDLWKPPPPSTSPLSTIDQVSSFQPVSSLSLLPSSLSSLLCSAISPWRPPTSFFKLSLYALSCTSCSLAPPMQGSNCLFATAVFAGWLVHVAMFVFSF